MEEQTERADDDSPDRDATGSTTPTTADRLDTLIVEVRESNRLLNRIAHALEDRKGATPL
jgi:hypothetical protein